ncbi:polysaccharide lyase family protein [Gramella sp. AN32]|uniref:rhamnogalacturonan endolyase n=1 Tax=Christiangramia antarctica TaxID=2058158 RepID=A0ABW5X134_9FLAO|nr:polysaccharide lyase family protein [Gramella sp. AN32]MCM4157251.1 hypothetical protein [Gramella sp. AN32]
MRNFYTSKKVGIGLLMIMLPFLFQAQELTWKGAVDSNFWNAGNWAPEDDPGANYTLQIGAGTPYQPVFTGNTNRNRFSSVNTLEGGELTVEGLLMTWGSDQLNGNVIVNKGRELNIRSSAFIGKNGTGRVDILGGALYTKQNVYLGYGEGGNGTIYIEDGILEPGEWFIVGSGKVILRGSAQLRLKGDIQTEVEAWVQEGVIVPERNFDKISWTYNAQDDRTVVSIYQDPNSLLKESPNTIVLENDYVHAEIDKDDAHITSYLLKGREMSNDIYFSMDGGSNYTQPSGSIFSVKELSDDFVDISLKSYWEPGKRSQAVDIDIHYVLERDGQGVYTYAILSHPENYPATGFSEWRMVWKLDQDQVEYICVDSLRHWEMPNSYDYANATSTSIAEIIKINTGVRAGKYDSKYDYNVEYWDIGTYGHASQKNDIGSWLVFGGYDYFNDGPTKQDLSAATGIIHVHFGMNHYNGSSTYLEAGEEWSKIYGPYKLYLNDGKGSVGALWDDAKSQADEEKAKWPYDWLTNTPEYPMAAGRGTVSGVFSINDPYKPDVTGGGAMIGLAQHEPGGNWQFESKNYQYWVKADASGKFEIPDVRPGNYTLYAFSEGAVREYKLENVQVSAAQTTNLGGVTWNIPREKGSLIWEIGIPDRTAEEFFHGKEYFQGFLWETFSDDFSNPLEYTIDESDWSKDWNYAHNGYKQGDSWDTWKWNVNFDVKGAMADEEATLTIAFAGAHYARMEVFINNEETFVERFYPSHDRGNALLREGIHAKYSVYEVKFPSSLLKKKGNTISLAQGRSEGGADHVMYDYLSLEIPMISSNYDTPNNAMDTPAREKLTKISPNPSNGLFTIEFGRNLTNGAIIEIFNSNGTLVHSVETGMNFKGNTFSVDCTKFIPGVYFVRVRTDRAPEVHRVILR